MKKMKASGTLVSAAVLLLAAIGNAQAFDAQRQGFQGGIGIGAHTSEVNQENHLDPSSIESKQKVALDFHIGYGFTNRIVGFLGAKGGSALIDGRAGTVVVSGFGGTIYWAESAPSLYLTGMIGRGSMSLQDENPALDDSGSAWLAGVGYEVSKGLHLELSHASADLIDPNNTSNRSAMTMTFATVKYVWY